MSHTEITNGVRNRTFRQIFHPPARYHIPFFQRGYAWEKKQWEQLFVDIEEQIVNEAKSGTPLSSIEYFFGPIVVLEEISKNDELKEYMIVDGQQRFTTVYLLLGAIKHSLEAQRHLSDAADAAIAHLSRYIANDTSNKHDDYLKLKVFSSKGDRLPTYRSVFGKESNPKTPFLGRDQELYIPGNNRVEEFQAFAFKKIKAKYNNVEALIELSNVILDCLKVVWIPLDAKRDDPQAIFESLNDKGMPLKASELLCNYLFQPIIRAEEEFESLHNELWLTSLKTLNNNDQFEEFLRTLFSIGETKMVGKNRKVYVNFKSRHQNLTSIKSREWLKKIRQSSVLYLSIVDPIVNFHDDIEIKNILYNISNTRMDSSTPFILATLIALKDNIIPLILARSILREILVLLVRRKMTEQSTTQYDVMFPSLLGKIVHENNVIAALHDQFRRNGVWVSDQEFRDAIINKPLYRQRDVAFTRMVLIEIDKSYQKYGQMPDYSTVRSVEHTLPQTPDQKWLDYLGPDADNELLSSMIHTAGNLCLLSGPANSAAGRNPFDSKVEQYSNITAIAQKMKSFHGIWNIAAIRERSSEFAERATTIWNWAIP